MEINERLGSVDSQKTFPLNPGLALTSAQTTPRKLYLSAPDNCRSRYLAVAVLAALMVVGDLAVLGLLEPMPTSPTAPEVQMSSTYSPESIQVRQGPGKNEKYLTGRAVPERQWLPVAVGLVAVWHLEVFRAVDSRTSISSTGK